MNRLTKMARQADLPVLILFAVILLWRVAWVLLFEPHTLVKDAVLYDNAAHWFMDTGTFAVNNSLNASAWVVPGYSFFLSLVYWVFGWGEGSLTAVRMVQTVLSVLTILVIYRVALRLWGRRIGIAFVVLAGLYPPFLLANEYILTEVLYTFLLSLVVLFGVRLLDKTSWKSAVAFGVILALSAYVRPPGAIWGIMPFLLLLGRVPLKRLAAVSAVALVAFCLCLSPWWIRNARIYDRFVPFTTNTGFTLVRGTYEMYSQEGYSVFLPSMISRDELLSPQEELEADANYTSIGVNRIKQQLREDPAGFVYGRAKATVKSFVTPTYPSLSSFGDSRPALARTLLRGFQAVQLLIVVVPALAAFWIGRKDRRVLLLWSLPLLVGLVYAAILISPRYVFPTMPVVLLLAAFSWMRLFGWVSARRTRGRDSTPES